MLRYKILMAAVLGSVITGVSAVPAKAVLVDYKIAFSDASGNSTGSGILVLDLPTVTTAFIPWTDLPNSIFSSLSATFGALHFELTNSNIAYGGLAGAHLWIRDQESKWKRFFERQVRLGGFIPSLHRRRARAFHMGDDATRLRWRWLHDVSSKVEASVDGCLIHHQG
jgi:hypothetical protein